MFQGSIPFDKPFFTGSICGYYIRFEREEYETIQIQLEKYKFFLNKIHSACMTLCDKLDWNGTAFENAYKESIESGFRFRREYKRLRTRNKQHWGQSILEKTEETSTLKIRIENNEILEITMLQKQNWFVFDSANRLGDKMKWLDNDRFGFEAKESGELLYYSMSERKVSSNLRPRPWGM